MQELEVFKNEQFGTIRVVERNGEPWFVAADLCRALDISNTQSALLRLREDEKGKDSIRTHSGTQEMPVVSEPGLYALVLGSRKPEAEAFQRWITHEVIRTLQGDLYIAAGHCTEKERFNMLNNIQNANYGFDEAVSQGYRICTPKRQTAQEKQLCRSLGKDYHSARLACWNIAHRVIGDGWSVAVYPTAKGRNFYVVELWSDYCRTCTARVHGAEYGEVKRIINLLERKYIHGDPALDDIASNPAWTLTLPEIGA